MANTFLIKRGDLLPEISATLKDATGAAVNLTGSTVKFIMYSQATGLVKVNASATVVTPASGTVKYTWTGTDTDTAGLYNAEWQETTSGAKKRTFPNDGFNIVNVVADLAD